MLKTRFRGVLLGKSISTILIVLIVAGAYNWFTSGSREPSLYVTLSDDDAFTLASMILARGRVTGCGDLRVVGQSPGRAIRVECGRDDTVEEYRVTYYPDFEVDFRPVADRGSMSGLMNEERIARIHCVQYPDGSWEKSYLRETDALRRAEEISIELNESAAVFYGYDGSWARMGDDGDGTWSMRSGDFEHDPQGYGPDGCRI
jgi:hypothetical protein